MIGRYERRMVEYLAYLYLRCLSFEQVRSVAFAWFGVQVIGKEALLRHVEEVADSMPESGSVSARLRPARSGYYALDGTWIKLNGEDLVLLIMLDVRTLDVVGYAVARDETEAAYGALLDAAAGETAAGTLGFFCDGDPGLLMAVRVRHPGVPVQLCVFHKYSRAGQVACFVRPKTELDREIKRRVERVLFAPTRDEAVRTLRELEEYTRKYEGAKTKLRKVVNILKRNFDLLLTHYDHPEMSPYNNVLEGFNYLVKRRTRLMKGFKAEANVGRWIKLLILDWRFHPITSSVFASRNKKSPLQLAGCDLPEIPNWITYVREKLRISP